MLRWLETIAINLVSSILYEIIVVTINEFQNMLLEATEENILTASLLSI